MDKIDRNIYEHKSKFKDFKEMWWDLSIQCLSLQTRILQLDARMR